MECAVEGASGVVLAGGQSRRMGRPKALLPFATGTLLEWVVRRVRLVCAEVVVVAREGVVSPGLTVVTDRFADAGPLAGLHAGLLAVHGEDCLVVACDLPFVQPPLLQLLREQLAGWDAVVPLVAGHPEPLCAAYRRAVALPAEALLREGGGSLRELLARLQVCFLGEDVLRAADPELVSFFNLNTPADYQLALQRLAAEADHESRSSPL
ncbi:MAG: putative molybdenum cofactor guanylyltransferase [Dehalococcoidia bacterium]|nr:MAG: putative molybdenum cofactor guanylyltransferase [Dehalococcoidia bacterium]